MNESTTTIYIAVLASLQQLGPRPLQPRLDLEAEGTDADVTHASLLQHLRCVGPNDTIRRHFSLQFAAWDNADISAQWTDRTTPRTMDRRLVIYNGLAIPSASQPILDSLFRIREDSHVVIARAFEPWYTAERQQSGSFYWPAYRNYLLNKPGWTAESIANLENATLDVVRRLSDPTRADAYQSKGLVVGYVQSGKTANITGVLAKAIDAGYRLAIVMTGTIDLLREQTQRRIDMELVGTENILREIDPDDADAIASVDYQDDPDWDRFIRHGFLPSSRGLPDIIRLTNHRFGKRTGDYRSLLAGITALEFQKHDNTQPLNDPVNLSRASARLAVVKKNKTVLTRLVRDLKSIRPKLAEIPALIIDDESDHASVNTLNPSRWEAGRPRRTAINGLISELLSLLPRAQYVGYTATPFANVFIDPNDAEDIFPKDFIIALSRPPGYMGAMDFHNLDPDTGDDGQTVRSVSEKAHIRDLKAGPDDTDGRAAELREALAMFVLTGGLKLFRERHGSLTYRHHTMLAHESVRRAVHSQLATEIRGIWSAAGFSTPGGLSELKSLYDSDIVPVSTILNGAPLPTNFDQLKPFIGDAISRITESEDPVIVVNSDNDLRGEQLDFGRRSVWRVLVGGAKLSRGFTVEGLTVSYYRRKTWQADTLLQMGRWFGFRQGYRDLVRLYIDRGRGDPRHPDLYEAFGAIVRSEEMFREELARYAQLVDGKPQITPAQVPPLVTQHLPWLRPTSRQKMFNARLLIRRQLELEPTAYPKERDRIAHNYRLLCPLMAAAVEIDEFRDGKGSTYRAHYIHIRHVDLLPRLKDLAWCYSDLFAADLRFLEELEDTVDDWTVLMPQHRSTAATDLPDVGLRSVFYRKRTRDPLFQAISDPKHRYAARRIAGFPLEPDPLVAGPDVAEKLQKSRRGALVLYPIVENTGTGRSEPPPEISEAECIIGMRIVAPYAARARNKPYVEFQVHNPDHADDIVVPGPGGPET